VPFRNGVTISFRQGQNKCLGLDVSPTNVSGLGPFGLVETFRIGVLCITQFKQVGYAFNCLSP